MKFALISTAIATAISASAMTFADDFSVEQRVKATLLQPAAPHPSMTNEPSLALNKTEQLADLESRVQQMLRFPASPVAESTAQEQVGNSRSVALQILEQMRSGGLAGH